MLIQYSNNLIQHSVNLIFHPFDLVFHHFLHSQKHLSVLCDFQDSTTISQAIPGSRVALLGLLNRSIAMAGGLDRGSYLLLDGQLLLGGP